MASYGERSVVPLWLILAVAAPLLFLMRATSSGQLALGPVEEFAVNAGTVAVLFIGAVLGATTISSGRSAAWWPTLIAFLGLGAWLYLTLQSS